MTQNNLYMEDDNLKLYVDVQPTFIDELESSKNAAANSAAQAAQSASNAQGWLNDIISYKTNLELYYAQSINNLSNWYNDTIAELANLKSTCLQAITTLSDSVLSSITNLYQQIISTIQTTGQSYINQTREYAEQARDAVDNRVSEEYLIQSNALESGSVSNISNVLSDITKYAHSSFCGYQASDASPIDPKKIVVIGVPTITSGGVASGFSSDNYINITSALSSLTKTYKIDFEFTISSNISNGTAWSIMKTNFQNMVRAMIFNSKLALDVFSNSSTVTRLVATNNLDINTSYVAQAGQLFNGTLFLRYKKATDENWIEDISLPGTLLNLSEITSALIGTAAHATNEAFNGSIDLKQFSITVDGAPVFSGNKTGIDTIKPVDFTAITSSASSPFVNPTLPFSDNGLAISADGIASGFSGSNYLTASLSTNNSYTNLEYYLGEITVPNFPSNQWFYLNVKTVGSLQSGFQIMLNTSGNARYFLGSGASHWDIVSGKVGDITYTANTKIKFKLVFNGSRYTLYSSVNNGDWQVDSYVDSTLKIDIPNNLTIGSGYDNPFLGSIDLNAFKIYVDGSLVYQPCLKIPYIQSSDKYGSKIVDSIYRDRVKDAFEQGFDQRYYTLDETNGNYTLPMGDLYGMIENLRKQIVQIAAQGE